MSNNARHGIEAGIARLLAQPWFSLLARIALTAAFWLSGIGKLADFPGAVGEVRGLTGLESAALVAAAVIFVQIVGSLLVIWGGRWAWLGAGALGVFTLAASLMAHAWWVKSGIERVRDFNTFWEHMGLIGGLMLAAILANRGMNTDA
ncbi:MAG: DoxX family protein [Xanthobacteraceae bacterium]|nr:DoxX family protein [Xanthobacteraceae bacterium]